LYRTGGRHQNTKPTTKKNGEREDAMSLNMHTHKKGRVLPLIPQVRRGVGGKRRREREKHPRRGSAPLISPRLSLPMYKNMDSFNIAIFVPNLHGGKRAEN
jgi:hypothetical protein